MANNSLLSLWSEDPILSIASRGTHGFVMGRPGPPPRGGPFGAALFAADGLYAAAARRLHT
jgi:hypothetical protein